MPLYDYHCATCGASWEAVQTISNRDEPLKVPCTECDQHTIKRDVVTGTIVSGVNMRAKVPQGFRDVLTKIRKSNPYSKIEGELC